MMPRRNRNAKTVRADADELAHQAAQLAEELNQDTRIRQTLDWIDSWQIEIVPLPPVCVGCFTNPATEGNYCALCKGRIILDARRTTVKRR
jgi:hypothetical protein